MKIRFCMVLLFFGTLFPCASHAQTTWTVDQAGGGDFATIQACIDAASEGDTCQVNPGTYVENIDYLGKNITVESTSGPEETVIDGSQSGRVVVFKNDETEQAVLDGFTIQNGRATYGGGIYCGDASPIIKNCTIRGNEAHVAGGVYCAGSASPTIINCTIDGNRFRRSPSYGWKGAGGVYCDSGHVSIRNCTIVDNGTEGNGGGVYCGYRGTVTIVDSILWGNAAENGPEIYIGNDGTVNVSYSDVKGGAASVYPTDSSSSAPGSKLNWGQGNIDEDPRFCQASCRPRDLHLASDSPCLGTGQNGANMGSMGQGCALPLDREPIIFRVPQESSTIQEAIDASCDGDTVLVAPGTYVENIDFLGKGITVRSDFDGDPETHDIALEETVIDGNQDGTVVTFSVGMWSDGVLDGFTIRNGDGYEGGGINAHSSSAAIMNCFVTQNTSAGGEGGGIYRSGNATITGCTIAGNLSYGTGGGIHSIGNATITDSTITLNAAWYEGGGGIYCKGNTIITGCTIAKNSTLTTVFSGGGIYCSGDLIITNSILWSDTAIKGPEVYIERGTAHISYSDVQGGEGAVYPGYDSTLNWGDGNIDADPRFCFTACLPMDVHLASGSPCLSAAEDGADMGSEGLGCQEPFSHDPVIYQVPDDFPTIQEAVDASCDGDTILVAPGTYLDNIRILQKGIALRSDVDGDPETYDIAPGETIIEGNDAYSVITIAGAVTPDVVLDGFAIRKGVSGAPDFYSGAGGGVFSVSSSPSLLNCTIMDNWGASGGGAAFFGGAPIVAGCNFTNNHADFAGGGIFFSSADPLGITITNCAFVSNRALSWVPFSVNFDVGTGGGLDCNGNATVINSTFTSNESTAGAGVASALHSASPGIPQMSPEEMMLDIVNCTFVGNNALHHDGFWLPIPGGVISSQGHTAIRNSILRTGEDTPSPWEGYWPLLLVAGGSAEVIYSDLQSGEAGVGVHPDSTLFWGDGNIDMDPLFVPGPLGDFYLSQIASGQEADSPCVDAGDPATEPWGWASLTTRTDQMNDTGVVDMGYHYPLSCSDEDGDGYSVEGGGCGEVDCDDSNAVTYPGALEICDGQDNNCEGNIDEEPQASASCSNGLFCDGEEVCSAGVCRAGQDPCLADPISCSIETCNEETDACEQTLDHSVCDDGLWCNGPERCDAAQGCVDGDKPDCDDGVGCTVDTCNEDEDLCEHEPDDDACPAKGCGQATCYVDAGCVYEPIDAKCTDTQECLRGICEADLTCTYDPDDTLCKEYEICNGETGICEARPLTPVQIPESGVCGACSLAGRDAGSLKQRTADLAVVLVPFVGLAALRRRIRTTGNQRL